MELPEEGDADVFFGFLVYFHFLLIPMLAYSNSSSIVREEVGKECFGDGEVLVWGSWVLMGEVEVTLLTSCMLHSRSGSGRVGDLALAFISEGEEAGEVGGAGGVEGGSREGPRIGLPDGEVGVGLFGVFHVSMIYFLQLLPARLISSEVY